MLQYAHAHGLPGRVVERLLVPLTAGLFFLPPERYSAFVLFGLLAQTVQRLRRLRIGAFTGPMTEALAAPWRPLHRAGRVNGVRAGGERLGASHVVLATSLAPAQRLLRRALGEPAWLAPLLRLPSMAVVTFQAELDRPLLPVDRTTFSPGTVLASYAEQSRTTFRHAPGRLSVICSPPEPLLEAPPEEVLATVLADAERLGLDLAGTLRTYRVVRLAEDFMSLAPGHVSLRPDQRTPMPGLTLAGDWTAQPFLATMEGAVISGRRAARVVLEASPGGGGGRWAAEDLSVARNQLEVAAPPSVVFAVLANPARYPDWVVGAKEISSFDHDWPAPGASFRHRFGLGPAAVSDVTTVLAADPPAELVLVACFGPVGAAEVRIRVDRSGAGSLVTMEERPVSGPLGAVRGARLLDLAIHLRNAESLRRLRRLAQGQGEPSTAPDS